MELERQGLRDARVKAWRNSRLSLMTITDRDLHFPTVVSMHQKEFNQFNLYTKPVSYSHFF